MIITIVVSFVVIIYVCSIKSAYKYFQQSYSKGGQWDYLHATVGDVVFCIIPVANTIVTLILLAENLNKKKQRNLDDFFKVKK